MFLKVLFYAENSPWNFISIEKDWYFVLTARDYDSKSNGIKGFWGGNWKPYVVSTFMKFPFRCAYGYVKAYSAYLRHNTWRKWNREFGHVSRKRYLNYTRKKGFIYWRKIAQILYKLWLPYLSTYRWVPDNAISLNFGLGYQYPLKLFLGATMRY